MFSSKLEVFHYFSLLLSVVLKIKKKKKRKKNVIDLMKMDHHLVCSIEFVKQLADVKKICKTGGRQISYRFGHYESSS